MKHYLTVVGLATAAK